MREGVDSMLHQTYAFPLYYFAFVVYLPFSFARDKGLTGREADKLSPHIRDEISRRDISSRSPCQTSLIYIIFVVSPFLEFAHNFSKFFSPLA